MLPNALCNQIRCCWECCASDVLRRARYKFDNVWLESNNFDHKDKVTAYQSQDQWQSLVWQPRREKEKLTWSLWLCARYVKHRLQLDGWSQLGKAKRQRELTSCGTSLPSFMTLSSVCPVSEPDLDSSRSRSPADK